MAVSSATDTTPLLRAWADGDGQALEALSPTLYRELRGLAGRCIPNERPGQTLQVSGLVHEACLHLSDLSPAMLMRRFLVDRMRKRMAAKRSGRVLPIDSGRTLDDALTIPGRVAPRKTRIVELRFFAGREGQETADAIGVSQDTVIRDWMLATAWLLKELAAS